MIFRLAAKDRRRGESRRAEDRRRRRLRPTLLALEERKLLSTIVVNNPTDTPVTGEFDLRQAIDMANTNGGNETITFDGTVFATPQTITLTGGQLELSDTTGSETITGPAAGVTISGGGLSRVFQVDNGVTASFSGLTITGGNTAGNGGGLYNDGGTVTLTGCTVSGNASTLINGRSGGGGIATASGTTTLTECTVSGNSAARYGGGLLLNGGTMMLTDCTVSGNSSALYGGGLCALAGTTTLTSCTVSGNSVRIYFFLTGGGVANFGTATLTDTIVAGNTSGSSPSEIYGTVGGTYDLIGTGDSGGLANGVDGSLVGVADPGLGALGNYGGPTETIPLLPGSPAIDAGTSAGAPTTDQRGEPRVGGVDIGAFESQGFTMTPVAGSTPQTATISAAFANPLAVAVTANNPIEPVDGGVVSFAADPAANGASAILVAPSAVIAGGQAGVGGGPNDVDGSYTVTASAAGLAPASFDLTNTGPVVTSLVVDTTSGSTFAGAGLLSLPLAVAFANADSSENADITFDPGVFGAPQTITLAGAPLELSNTSESETITGPSSGLTISGGGRSRVFQVDQGVTASIAGLTISGGQVTGNGGGVSNSGTLTMTDCTVSGNTAVPGSGTAGGGGIYNDGTLSLTDSTIAANSTSGYYHDSYGGGIFNSGLLTVTGSTITGNLAPNYSCGLRNSGGTATLTDTIVAGNSYGDISGPVSGTYDLIGTGGSGGLVNGVDGNLVGVADPGLGALGNYGGPTETIPLLPGSPAIDAGTSAGAPATDQRGEPRVGAVDIGAFESQGFTITPVGGSTPQSAAIGAAFDSLAVAVTANNPVEPVDGGVVSFVANPAANGASAILLASSSVIAGGQAGVGGGPNDVDGSYTVTASGAGLAPASFDLTNSGPVFTKLVVNTTSGAPFAGAGLLSLPLAVDFANAESSGNANIRFDPGVFGAPQTITLAGTQLELSNTSVPITIAGPGAGALTIDAGGKSRVFAIDPGVTATISGLTVTGGASGGVYVSGGDLLNQGTLTLTGVTLRGGSAYAGGGLDNSGTATLVDSTIADNLGNRGAGLFNGGTVTLEDCTVAGNTGIPGGLESVSLGGGLFNWGSLTMIGGSVTGDTANSGSAVYSGYGTVTNLRGTTIRDNPNAGYPGSYEMIYNRGGAMSLADCTISGDSSAPIAGFGIKNYYYGQLHLADCTVEGFSNGGILNANSSALSMSGCQIINNTGKGGLVNYSGDATLTDCVISGNTTSGAGYYDGHRDGLGGGGVLNLRGATLAMTDCLVDGNLDVATPGQYHSSYGGGIFNQGTMTLTGCTLRDNMASGPGGALFNSGQATLTDCTIRGNSASVGGGIDNTGQLTASGITLSGNSAVTGGGIANAAGATATVGDSSINDNAAAGDGGGIANAGTLSLTDTRIRGNTAAVNGGGLYNSGIAALTDCLVSGNTAASGGGIYAAAGGSVTLTGTRVIGNEKDNIVGTVTYD
jgi:fibronectin-binding autotransporter adhesin